MVFPRIDSINSSARLLFWIFPGRIGFEELFKKLAGAFSLRLETSYSEILRKLNEREAKSTTLISDDLAIPHIVLDGEEGFEIVMVRAREGILFQEEKNGATVVFALAGSFDERNFHLKCLMAIAQITRSTDFVKRWNEAFDEEELRILVRLAERSR